MKDFWPEIGWVQQKLESVQKEKQKSELLHFQLNFSIWRSKKSTPQPRFLNPPVYLLSNFMSDFWIEIGWVQQKLESVQKEKQKS